ncbi:MAG: aminoacyl-histidine dipeptidase [Planctomycetaceae bacterium]|nr:aminoacyl-histidine dipeptidase [Planctomycetaceae bacterium]
MSNATHAPIRALSPTSLWGFFCDLNQVPRASKHEARVTEFAADFGRRLQLETLVDSVGNVIIRKPATAGLELRTPVILQAHLDMVHQKNSDTAFDFATQGIEMECRGDWVAARGTTLGADNGIGVAAIMAVLASADIPHPPLEALFTVDEETGMTGAKGLAGGLLRGKVLLNLDTEEDDELTIGCAGGVDVTATGTYSTRPAPVSGRGLRVFVRGLKGGHSGMDIHLGRGNANQILARLLCQATKTFDLQLQKLDGGSLRNAIPREAIAEVVVAASDAAAAFAWLQQEAACIAQEYHATDPELNVDLSWLDEAQLKEATILEPDFQRQFLSALYACPNGVSRMSPQMAGLVETSNNLARVIVDQGEWKVGCLTRSSINSARDNLARRIAGLWELIGGQVTTSGDYPGWQPQPDSLIVQLMRDTYRELFGAAPKVAACHGGLECGILGSKYPDVQMISFGPNIRGAHSPDEQVQISSVQKSWRLLLEVLRRL